MIYESDEETLCYSARFTMDELKDGLEVVINNRLKNNKSVIPKSIFSTCFLIDDLGNETYTDIDITKDIFYFKGTDIYINYNKEVETIEKIKELLENNENGIRISVQVFFSNSISEIEKYDVFGYLPVF